MTNNLTPYDTGARLEPKLWVTSTSGTLGNASDFGKVDFENDESSTELTIYVEPDADSVNVVNIEVHFGDFHIEVAEEGRYIPVEVERSTVMDAITAVSAFGLDPWDALLRIAEHVGLVVDEDETGARYVANP